VPDSRAVVNWASAVVIPRKAAQNNKETKAALKHGHLRICCSGLKMRSLCDTAPSRIELYKIATVV
jgi:hypothetical protein